MTHTHSTSAPRSRIEAETTDTATKPIHDDARRTYARVLTNADYERKALTTDGMTKAADHVITIVQRWHAHITNPNPTTTG